MMISAFNITCMDAHDDELRRFEASGATPLPVTDDLGYVENDGARIWYSSYGIGPPVILLHGGLGHSGNWGIPSSGSDRERLSCGCDPQPRPRSQHSRWTALF